jgi:hypothetical protein
MKRLVLIAVCAAALAGCETVPLTYMPASGPRSPGYFDQKIESDRFRVSYRGPAEGNGGQVYDFALLRAAQLTLSEGYEWFRVIGRSDDMAQASGPRISLGTGSTSFGRRSAVGVGIGTGFNLGGGDMRSVTLEVKLGKGPRPADRDAYDARDVSRTIGARAPGGPRP